MAGLFEKLKAGLAKTRTGISNGLDSVFGDYSQVDDDFFEELEEILIMSDMGLTVTDRIIADLRSRIKSEHIKSPSEVRRMLVETVSAIIEPDEHSYDFENEKCVILVVGVNGVGKTTSIGKLAVNYVQQGKKVMLCAADTYRAAAAEQLRIWADRAGVEIIAQQEGADPAAVVFDAAGAFRSRNYDIMICDTAGRLHNKKNLMNELSRITRVLDRELPGIRKEILLVLDATTGQNALAQAREFADAAGVTGMILTKLDGTARGGIVVAVSSELGIPVKFIGVGEQADDLQKFHAEEFLRAIFSED